MTGTFLKTAVHFERRGCKGAPKVLMLHGWGCSSMHFDKISDALEEQFDILIPDFPGHGKSAEPPEPWGVASFADCIYALLKDQDFLPCSLIAHSFGGRVAIVLSTEHPADFEKLVFTGCAGIPPKKTEAQKKKAAQYQQMKRAIQRIEKVPFLRKPAQNMMNALRDKYGSSDYKALNENMRATFVKVVNQDLSPLLAKIQSPVLLIWGAQDTETPLWMGETMEAQIPDAGLVVFENDDHFAYLREWPRFVAIVKTFFLDT